MMSIFNSFDLSFFNLSLLVYVLMIWRFLLTFFKISLLETSFKISSLFMSKFFHSLNNSNFAKSFNSVSKSGFFLIFVINFFSIFSFIFPASSQVSLILIFSFWFFIPIFGLSIFLNFSGQLSHFIPESAPLTLAPFLFLVEMVSFLIRPLTLMVRLVANILAGHLLLILLCALVSNFPPFFILLSFLNMFEFAVALIQAYIFFTLVSLYYSEV